jgi:hypothetical protein
VRDLLRKIRLPEFGRKMVRLRRLILENSEGFCMIDVAFITL